MTINVNNLKWNIIYTNNKNDLMLEDGTITLGVTDRNLQCVFIYDKLYGNMLKKVLIHELTHVWLYSYNYNLTIDEEEFICGFMDLYSCDIIDHINHICTTTLECPTFHCN